MTREEALEKIARGAIKGLRPGDFFFAVDQREVFCAIDDPQENEDVPNDYLIGEGPQALPEYALFSRKTEEHALNCMVKLLMSARKREVPR